MLYRRVPRLFEELGLARAEEAAARLLAKLAKFDLLILEDLGVGTLKETQRHGLPKVFEDRSGQRSTIATTNLAFSDWPTVFPNATCATALIDRLVHDAEIIAIEGNSYRRREAEAEKKVRKRRVG